MSKQPTRDHQYIVISGPSGVGKGSLCRKLIDAHPRVFTLSVSHTTRKPRNGEVNGADYFFVQPAVFQSLISEKAFLEWSIFSGNYYGTSNQTIEKAIDKGLTTILDVDMEGIKRLKESSLNANARYVFIKPPSFEALEKRLRNRDTEKEEDIRKRLAQASKELEYAGKPGVYDKIIVNDDLEKAYRELKDFVKDLH